MRYVNHENGRSLCFEIGFTNFQVFFPHRKVFYSTVDLRIADGTHEINLVKHVAKLEWPGFRIGFIPLPGFEGAVVAFSRFFQLTKNLIQRSFPDTLLCLGRDFYFPFFVFIVNISFLLKVFNKISNAILWRAELILLVQFSHPSQGFFGITIGIV